MSLYQQNSNGYVSNLYGAGGGYPGPSSFPFPRDPIEFRNFFNSHLATLTVNQRAIIHNLSYIARECASMFGPLIAQCIEQYIRRVAPTIKLPPFYLLDSISKNIGPPYTGLFSAFIASLFLDTYHAVDLPTRGKMEEMLVTWRTGAGGRELFGSAAQVAIESVVWGSGASSHVPTKAQVLTELEVILAQKQRVLELNPYDVAETRHVDVLHQLRLLIQTTSISNDELMAIATQLRTLARTTASSLPPAPIIPPPPPAPAAAQSTSSSSALFTSPPMTSYPAPDISVPSLASLLTATSNGPSINVVPPSATETNPNISELFQSLLKAGLVTDTSLFPSHTDDPVKTEDHDQEQKPALIAEHDGENDYERTVMSMQVKLTSSGIQREQPEIVYLLYDRLPLQCKQCALRFDSGPVGKQRMDDHLDLHFRQNRKASQNTGRGHWRSWFVGIDDWTHDVVTFGGSSEDKGKRRADGPQSAKAVAAAAAEREAQLRASFVVVPTGDESKTIVCPICKEVLQTEFLEDDEEWVWKNAKEVKGKIYHATCHADASATAVAARVRGLAGSGSRSGTPDSISLPQEDTKPLPSLAGTKRKSPGDEVEIKVKSEPSDEPPVKKLALSSSASSS